MGDTGQVWRTIAPLWAGSPSEALLLHTRCQPASHAWAISGGGGGRVLSLLQEEREHEIRGMGLGVGEKGVLIEKVRSKKPNILLLSLAGRVTNTLLFRTFCPFFQLLLPGLSGVQLASEGQLCAAV